MILYILQATVITTICFLFYKLLLQKETFYHLNRWTLMACLALSFTLPLLPIPRAFSWRDKWEEQLAWTKQVVQEKVADNRTPVRTPDAPSSGVTVTPIDDAAQPASQRTSKKKSQRIPHTHLKTASQDRAARPGTGNPADQGNATANIREHKTGPWSNEERSNGLKDGTEPGTTREEAMLLPVITAQRQGMQTASSAGAANAHKTGQTPEMAEGASSSGPMVFLVLQWLFYGYLFGLVLFGGNFFLQIAVLLYQSYSRPVIRDGRFRIVEIRGDRAPCSFGNTIFINPENYDWETYNQILIHEKIHVSGRHTLDILLAEVAVVLQWFNPFVWLYRREVENNLEFLTDASVLSHRQVERSAYQLSLLRVSAPRLPFSITNNYNQSLLKRRIVMMNSKRSSFHTVWKYFFLLPIFSILVCAMNEPTAPVTTKKSAVPGHPGVNTHPNVASATAGALPFGSPASAFATAAGDTSVRPSVGRGTAQGDSNPADSSRQDSWYDEGDNRQLKAKYKADLDGDYTQLLNDKLAAAERASVEVHFIEPQLIANAKLGAMNQDMIYKPVMDLKLDMKPKIYSDIDVSRMKIMADTDLREGAWFATSSDDKLEFELKAGDDDHNWSSSFHIEKSELNPFPGTGNVEFKLVREAGTIQFKGQFDGQEGFGHFVFRPDPGYFAALKQMGVEDLDDRREFAFFTVNIKKDYVDMVIHNGYPHINQRDLIAFAAMKIDKPFIQDWRGSGFDGAENPRDLISLKAMKIDRAYVDELKAAGYDHLNIHDLMSMKAQHIDRAYIRSLGRSGDAPIPVHELISYKAMHIDSGYLDGLRKVGYGDLSRHDVTSLYAMHITPEYIKSLQDIGYKDIPVRDLTTLKAMEITPDYIKGFHDIGYHDLPLKELSIYKSMHITPEYIKGFNEIGYKDLEPRQLTSFKSMDITPDFIKGFRDLGYTDLTPNDLNMLKAMKITPDFVRGFNKLGFQQIPVRMLSSLKATGVDADYVSQMKEKGFNSTDLNKYIRLKNDFN